MEDLVTSSFLGALPESRFWSGKRVLITGHTGFKGSWLAIWLHRLGASIAGLGLLPNTKPSLFELANVGAFTKSNICDIREFDAVARLIADFNPEVIFHLAAQPLVRSSYAEPIETFDINVMGSAYVLEAARSSKSVRTIVMVTTDKVYSNAEQRYPFRELDPLGGHDPYSASKAAAELVVSAYRSSFFAEKGVAVSTARAGNVIGGGDWAQDRLIPDAIRAWSQGATLQVRRPNSVRPWNHVLECLAGYLVLTERMWSAPQFASSWNFGPQTSEAVSVRTIIDMAQRVFGRGDIAWESTEAGPYESQWLALENSKARQELGVVPRWNARTAVEYTMRWYSHYYGGADARALCENDITHYMNFK